MGFFFLWFLSPLPCLLASSTGQLKEDLTSVNAGKKKKESEKPLIVCEGVTRAQPLCSVLGHTLDEWWRICAGRIKGGKRGRWNWGCSTGSCDAHLALKWDE